MTMSLSLDWHGATLLHNRSATLCPLRCGPHRSAIRDDPHHLSCCLLCIISAVRLPSHCSIERSNLFEQLCGLLSKAAFPTREGPLSAAHLQSLDGILAILSSLSAGCSGVSDLGACSTSFVMCCCAVAGQPSWGGCRRRCCERAAWLQRSSDGWLVGHGAMTNLHSH